MNSVQNNIEQHYGRGRILDSIIDALHASGKDLARLAPADLAPVDEFHIRGREATIELARRASLQPGMRVLDVGCGLGGSARYLATQYQCQVTGIDLTQVLGDGSALHYPVPWAEDAAMSFLATPGRVRQLLEDLGFVIHEWVDKSQLSTDWFVAAVDKLKATGPSPLGLHLLMGPTAKAKFANNIRNLRERRFVVFQALAQVPRRAAREA